MEGLSGISCGSSTRQRSPNVAITAPTSPRLKASSMRRTRSTFSCGTAYSDSPTASRAWARSRKNSSLVIA